MSEENATGSGAGLVEAVKAYDLGVARGLGACPQISSVSSPGAEAPPLAADLDLATAAMHALILFDVLGRASIVPLELVDRLHVLGEKVRASMRVGAVLTAYTPGEIVTMPLSQESSERLRALVKGWQR